MLLQSPQPVAAELCGVFCVGLVLQPPKPPASSCSRRHQAFLALPTAPRFVTQSLIKPPSNEQAGVPMHKSMQRWEANGEANTSRWGYVGGMPGEPPPNPWRFSLWKSGCPRAAQGKLRQGDPDPAHPPSAISKDRRSYRKVPSCKGWFRKDSRSIISLPVPRTYSFLPWALFFGCFFFSFRWGDDRGMLLLIKHGCGDGGT